MDIKEGLKAFRLRMNFKQEDLAKALNVNQQNISLWEAGKGYPSYLALKKLFELGATVEEIFGIKYGEMRGYLDTDTVGQIALQDIVKRIEILEKEKNLTTKAAKQEKSDELVEEALNSYFNSAKKCLEKQDIEENDAKEHYLMLAYHYSILMNLEKKLAPIDIEHLNDLNELVDKKYRINGKYRKEFNSPEKESENFGDIFMGFVEYCKQNPEKKYYEKALEVYNNICGRDCRTLFEIVENIKPRE